MVRYISITIIAGQQCFIQEENHIQLLVVQ